MFASRSSQALEIDAGDGWILTDAIFPDTHNKVSLRSFWLAIICNANLVVIALEHE